MGSLVCPCCCCCYSRAAVRRLHWAASQAKETVWQLRRFGGRKWRSRMNRISHPDWVKLSDFSIIHLRCIKEVFSDATVFIADFGLFLHHIGSDSNLGMTLEEPNRLRDRDVLRSCLHQSKEFFFYKGRSSTVLIDICPLENSQWK